jgi:hypothetical protein
MKVIEFFAFTSLLRTALQCPGKVHLDELPVMVQPDDSFKPSLN